MRGVNGSTLRAPFPYFGGKSRIAGQIWRRFGVVRNYVEPFVGSGAALLARPLPFDGTETVNDLDGLVANFWRALQAEPDAVAHHADWPANENDLHARHMWLVQRKDSLQAKLEGDPEHYDAKIAGWWCWGLCLWIGSGFCSGKGPWRINGHRQLVRLGDAGMGIHRKLNHLGDAGMGIHRQLIHLGNAGRGIHRKLIHLGDAGRGIQTWLQGLAARLRSVRVCCGDWRRVCGPTPMIKNGLTAFFLDPPYAAERDPGIYRVDDMEVANEVRDWCVEHGDNPMLRICLAGYAGESSALTGAGWRRLAWKAQGGYGSQAKHHVNNNCNRERLWFSPHCLRLTNARTIKERPCAA